MSDNVNVSMNVTISDQFALRPLADHLGFVAPAAQIRVNPGEPGPGELGAEDLLVIVAASPVLIAAIKTLPQWLQAQRNGLSVKLETKGKTFTLTAANADDVMPILDKLLHD